MLASIWRQLLPAHEVPSPALRDFWQQHKRENTRPSMEQVMSVMRDEVAKLTVVSILIDAVDELEPKVRNVLLEKIRSLVAMPELKGARFRLMFTSRQQKSLFTNASAVEIVPAEADVTLFVEQCIDDGISPFSLELSTHVQDDLDLRKAVTSTVVRKSKGMFLLARLYMDLLEDQISVAQIRNTIKDLHEGLDEVYGEVWKRVQQQKRVLSGLAQRAILWLSFASSQMTVDQLRHVVVTEQDHSDFDRDNMPATEVLIDACQGLVKIDNESQIIRLAHFTTYDFFRGELSRRIPDIHSILAKTCLTYLQFKVFYRGPCKYRSSQKHFDMLGAHGTIEDTDILARRIAQFPFMKYAADHWGEHARLSPESAIQSSILAFLEQPQCLASAIQTRYADSEFVYDSDLEARYAGSLKLHAAVCYGLEATVDLLLTTLKGAQIKSVDCRGKTALHWAIESSSTLIAMKLLHAGADLESKIRGERFWYNGFTTGSGQNISVFKGRVGRELDQLSPELVAKGDLVYISVKTNQIEILRTYLSSASCDAEKVSRATNVMFKASSLNRLAVLELALENGGLLDERDGEGKTPLVVAVENRHADTVQELLHHGCSLDRGTAPSLIQSTVSDQKTFKHPLRFVGEMFEPPPYGNTTEELGPGTYNDKIYRKVKALLRDGAIIPILRLQTSHTRFLKALPEDRSPKRIVKALLSYGADPAVRTGQGETLLHLAVCSPGRLKTLLESPTKESARSLVDDIEAEDCNGRTALHYAAAASNPRAMQILLSHGANINARDNAGATPLHYAVEDHECVYLALDAKPSVDARDYRGRNALHYLAMVAGDPDPNNLTDFQSYLMENNPARKYNDQKAALNDDVHYSPIPRDCDERTFEMLYKAFAEAQDRLPSARDFYGLVHGDYFFASREIQWDFAATASWLKQMKERYFLGTASVEGILKHGIKQATKEKKFWTLDRNYFLGQGSWSIRNGGSTEEVLSPGQSIENQPLVFEGEKPDILDRRNIFIAAT
ncbi:MAG: hypothetical protein Q9174_002893 [Haloplaca sp. 1 TL-2023]